MVRWWKTEDRMKQGRNGDRMEEKDTNVKTPGCKSLLFGYWG